MGCLKHRELNSFSDKVCSSFYSKQPWAPFFYAWNFQNEAERLRVCSDIEEQKILLQQFIIVDFHQLIRLYFQEWLGCLLFSFCAKINTNNLL